ncbi:MAG: hypothetical protein H6558_21675 [Lewinellaceae bacterium]|nr:hypothetical protein [Lewinellaceae bacterium]
MKTLIFKTVFLFVALAVYQRGFSQTIGNMYDYSTLENLREEYSSTLEKFLGDKLPRYLNPEQNRKLSEVRLLFPLRGEDSKDPFCYYAYARGYAITLSIQSLKFLDDLCLAYAWLTNKGYSVETVTDYVAMIRYKNPGQFAGGRYPPPLEALGIPRNAKNDPKTRNLALGMFLSAKVFILCHELGHIFYQHPGNKAVSTSVSRYHEEEADRFALSILKEIPVIPMGALLYFQVFSHWDWDSSDSTHPLNSSRLMDIGNQLTTSASDFARNPDTRKVSSVEKAVVHDLAQGFRQLAEMLADEDVQKAVFLAAKDRDPSTLKPRKKGQIQDMPGASSGLFSGYFQGQFIRYVYGQKESLPVAVYLEPQGNTFSGMFNFGLGDGLITDGWRSGNALRFRWSWAGITGKGVLYAENGGKRLKGTWGYNSRGGSSDKDGGEWVLYQE